MGKKDLADMVGGGLDLEPLLRGARKMEPPAADVATLPDEDLPDPKVQAMLSANRKGFPEQTFSNAVLIVLHDPRWSSLRLNELGPTAELHGRPLNEPRAIADLAVWIARVYGVSFGPGTIRDTIAGVVATRAYNPVKSYLEALRWDGLPRIGRVVSKVLRAEQTDLHQAFVRKFFIGAVARALSPGCKLDTALILVGEQGAYKSTFFKVLFGDWFADSPIPIGSKDAFIQLAACWGYEASEMESLSRGTAEAVKQFLSSPTDTYRGVFERFSRPHPRRSVMVGTTNRVAFLSDETGSRRFWPITVSGKIDIETARIWRDQLWAEAVTLYRQGEPWWLTDEEDTAREVEAQGYTDEDVWLNTVRNWLAMNHGDKTISEILSCALEMDVDRQDVRSARRVGAILSRLGYERVALPRVSGVRPSAYRLKTKD